jgi:LAS superfamily LD-carboxypeptidase LdcB
MPVPRSAATPARLATAAAMLALLAALLIRPIVAPTGARAMGPLPDCRYDDVLTTPRSYDDWSITLVDTILRLTKGYVPPDLVPVSQAGLKGGGKVRAILIDDLELMGEAAAAAGNPIGVESAYRSYATQQAVFQHWIEVHGRTKALTLSARPGHSEHQLGLTIDFRSEPPRSTLTGSWASTPAGKWMKAHAWEYGFIMSYPKGKMAKVCYAFEPWHFRYVGRDLAAKVHASGRTLREYLWANFTTTVVPPAPPPTHAPGKTAVPTLSPAASPSALPPSALPTVEPPISPPPTLLPATFAPSTIPPSVAPVDSLPPLATPPPLADGSATAIPTPALLAGAALGGLVALVVLALARRRGRSGVGL